MGMFAGRPGLAREPSLVKASGGATLSPQEILAMQNRVARLEKEVAELRAAVFPQKK